MRQSKIVRRDRGTTTYGAIEQPARCTVDAIISAAALMAYADGNPVIQERIALTAYFAITGSRIYTANRRCSRPTMKRLPTGMPMVSGILPSSISPRLQVTMAPSSRE